MNLHSYVKAAYPAVALVTQEEQRAQIAICDIGRTEKLQVYSWSITVGLIDCLTGATLVDDQTKGNPNAILERLIQPDGGLPARLILILKDYHRYIESGDPMVLRLVKDAMVVCEQTRRTIVFLGCQMRLPPELEKEVVLDEMDLPDRDELGRVLDSIASSAGVDVGQSRPDVVRAAAGLTTNEARNAFARAFIESGKKSIPPSVVADEKCQALNKSGILEIVRSDLTLDQVGGLDRLKEYLRSISRCFTDEAVEFGVEPPSPLFVVGQPGTGKTMVSHCIGPIFGVPVMRLDASRLMASHVGETEQNWRTVIQTIRSIAPCGFHIDEIDGTVGSVDTSGHTDGGVKAGLVKQMLQDIQRMQSEKVPVLWYFTANDIDGCPDPLIDRCSVWSVELPNVMERPVIWRLQLERRRKMGSQIDLDRLTELSDGFSGRQIDKSVKRAIEMAFSSGQDLGMTHLEEVCRSTRPTSVTMGDKIRQRRERLKDRAELASTEVRLELTAGRKF